MILPATPPLPWLDLEQAEEAAVAWERNADALDKRAGELYDEYAELERQATSLRARAAAVRELAGEEKARRELEEAAG